MRVASLAVLIAWGSPALARDPSCPDLTVAQFQAMLDAVDEAYLSQEFGKASAFLAAAEDKVPCVVEIVPTEDVARYALRRAYAVALDLDENEARRWALLARALQPDLPWPSYIPPDHAIRDLLLEAPEAPPIPLRGKGLVTPPSGGVFLDGRFLTRPEAEPGMPHLLQVGDASGDLVITGWQDGTAFPEDLLGPPPANPPTLPEWYGKPVDLSKIKPPKVARDRRPWTETRAANLQTAGGFAAAAGAMFASAWIARTAYDQRPNDGLFYAVNGATVASGVAGGASVAWLGLAVFGK